MNELPETKQGKGPYVRQRLFFELQPPTLEIINLFFYVLLTVHPCIIL
jgi:hypothetical protein